MSTTQEVLDALHQLVSDCLSECDYRITTTMGIPPAECNLVSVWPISSSQHQDTNRKLSVRTERVAIHIMRCCEAIDSNLDWDIAREAKEMRCLVRDVQKLEDCLQCELVSALEPLTVCATDFARVRALAYDDIRRGGCYGATFQIEYKRNQCCPPSE